MKDIKIVIGANFGDEGKGLMTDYFCGISNGTTPLVVLSNGGAQRGHTVITSEKQKHVFRHLGSGSFLGADTYISKYFIVNPVLFNSEYNQLKKYNFKVYLHPDCLLTTIFDMLINQIIEIDRAKDKHGSCGIGIYETLYRNQTGVDFVCKFTINPNKMTVKEFNDLPYLGKYNFLDYLRKEYVPTRLNIYGMKKDIQELYQQVLTNDNVINNYIHDFNYMMNVVEFKDETIFDNYDFIIFENGQGLLLDQYNMEYFPHLTPSNTGLRNPLTMLSDYGYKGAVEACYVTRTYMTRHGVGKFPTECSKAEINPNMWDATNVPNPFQDTLRYGKLNEQKMFETIDRDIYNNRQKDIYVIKSLALTHLNEYLIGGYLTNYKYLSYNVTRNDIKGQF